MEKVSNKSYESDFYNLQGASSRPIKGILIYEEAQKKLNISDSGKLYLQKFYNYIPIIAPIAALVYANFCVGKTKCLRKSDRLLFRGVANAINLFGFLIWPLIFFAIWTILTYLSVEFSQVGVVSGSFGLLTSSGGSNSFQFAVGSIGDYNNLWNVVLVNQLSVMSISNVGEFFKYLSILFSGLIYIFLFPLTFSNVFIISNAQINTNLIFILSILILTIINPVNIFNSIILNTSKLRFVIVYEASSIYRYRRTSI